MKAASIANHQKETIRGSLSGLGNPFKLAFEQSQQAQCLISQEGKILAANDKAKQLAQLTSAKTKLLGKHIWHASWWRAEQGITVTHLFKQALKNELGQAQLDLAISKTASSYQVQFTPITDVLGNVHLVLLEAQPLSSQLESTQLDEQSDSLTGLAKGHVIEDYMNAIIQNNKSNPSYFFAILSIKLKHLKRLRQTLSSEAQETLLVNIARQFRANTRDSDLVAKFSEDTFVIILDRLQVSHNALDFAERCLGFLENDCQLEGKVLNIKANIGIAFGDSSSSASKLFQQANDALEQAELSSSDILVYGVSQFEDGSI